MSRNKLSTGQYVLTISTEMNIIIAPIMKPRINEIKETKEIPKIVVSSFIYLGIRINKEKNIPNIGEYIPKKPEVNTTNNNIKAVENKPTFNVL